MCLCHLLWNKLSYVLKTEHWATYICIWQLYYTTLHTIQSPSNYRVWPVCDFKFFVWLKLYFRAQKTLLKKIYVYIQVYRVDTKNNKNRDDHNFVTLLFLVCSTDKYNSSCCHEWTKFLFTITMIYSYWHFYCILSLCCLVVFSRSVDYDIYLLWIYCIGLL